MQWLKRSVSDKCSGLNGTAPTVAERDPRPCFTRYNMLGGILRRALCGGLGFSQILVRIVWSTFVCEIQHNGRYVGDLG